MGPCPHARPCVGWRVCVRQNVPLEKILPHPMQTLRRNRCQTRTRPREKACVYGVRVSGATIFAYGYGNPIENTDPTGEAVPVFLYAKCVIECKATDALLAAVKSECDPRTLGDCAKECINPLNWAKIPGLKLATKARQTTKPSLPKKTFVPDSYYRKETRVADDLAPGIRDSVKLRIGSDGKEYLQTSHYDDYGRLVARTDHTSHPSLKPTHPDPHHHRYEYTPGSNGGSVKNPSTAPGGSPNVWPGAYR